MKSILSHDHAISALVLGFVFLACNGDDSNPATPPSIEDAQDTVGDAQDSATETEEEVTRTPCTPEPSPEALIPAGVSLDGVVLGPGGRELTPVGTNLPLEGFPSNVILHPTQPFAYIVSTSSDDRRLVVLDIESASVIQDLDRNQASFGLAMSQSGDILYSSGGHLGRVDVFSVAPDGLVSVLHSIETGGYPSGLALSEDGNTLWVGLFNDPTVLVVDTATLTVQRQITVDAPVWDLLYLASRNELYVSTLEGDQLSVINVESYQVLESIAVGQSPAGLCTNPDESMVWVAVAGIDELVAIDTIAGEIVGRTAVAETDLTDAQGAPLPNSNVNSVALDVSHGRLYATRAADNAVSVFNAATLELLGSFPTAWYPTGVAVSTSSSTLVVIEGKGFGSGPNLGRSSKSALTGSVTLVDLSSLDLTATTEAVVTQFNRPNLVFPFECDGDFPIPTRPDQSSPIEYVILVVKENKTFDCVFGDLTEMDVDVDPELVRWGEEITPNQHLLAREFAFADNFYTEIEDSDMGHILLTATHLTEFVERVWTEQERSGWFLGYQVADQATPEAGNFFTHLMDHDVDIRIYGEIVGMFAQTDDGAIPFDHSDAYFPGGFAVNYGFTDETKVGYVAERIAQGELATFTYLLLPNDHTVGTRPGEPTPESMVADNDYAVGLLVEALSESPYWETSVIFVVEDDPQGCEDHVDSHRSFATVIGPWARRNYVSHVNYSFVSVFATIERILGVPPLGRPDGSASPMWDMFTDEPDYSPFGALERQIPEEINSDYLPGSDASLAMDFRSPDRNPRLGVVLDAYRLWRMGRITREEANSRINTELPPDRLQELEEEAREESIAFDMAWQQYEAWLQLRQQPLPDLPLGPIVE